MIYKRVFTVPDTTRAGKNIAMEEIRNYLEPFGFILESITESTYNDYYIVRHVGSQVLVSLDISGNRDFMYVAGYELTEYGYVSPTSVMQQQIRTIKATNTTSGIGQLQCIIGSDGQDNMWITFSGYDSIDNIEGGVIAILGEKAINTNSQYGSVFEGSNTIIGTASPFLSNFVAEKDKTHISDAGVVSGNIIRETLPYMKSYASSEIRQYRFYTINGKKYLALPNRLLIEC